MQHIMVIAVSVPYILGLAILQAHLLKHGIFDLSPFEILYPLVGVVALATLVPSVAVAALIEVSLRWNWQIFFNTLKQYRYPLLIGLIVSFNFLFWILFTNPFEHYFNFNCYIFPPYFVLWNIAVGNIYVLVAWLFAFSLRHSKLDRRYVTYSFYFGITIALIVYTHYFGRTIYPAIDSAIGGGAPRFAEIKTKERSFDAIILYQSSHGMYYLEVEGLPQRIKEAALEPMVRYVGKKNDPIHDAIIENRVAFIPTEDIKSFQIFMADRSKTYCAYRDDNDAATWRSGKCEQ